VVGRILRFDALLVAVMVIATRVGCFVHEAIGHALLAYGFGAEIRSVEITLFGGGTVDWRFAEATSVCESVAVAAGMLLNLISGVIALGFARRHEARPILGPLVALFGAISVLLPVAYFVIGSYYGVGDPAALLPRGATRLVVLLLAVTPLVSYWALRPYCRIQQARFPSATVVGRLAIGALTIGVAGLAYLALYLASQRLMPQHLAVFDAARLASRPTGASSPSSTTFPMIPAVAIGYVLGAALAQWRVVTAAPAARLSWRAVAGTCAVAVSVLATLWAIGQRLV
jgi:hypothetical protein